MKVRKSIILSGLLLFSAIVCAAGEPIEKWTVWNYWQMLTPKMTEEVVIELIGEPLEKEFINNYQIWYYQGLPEKQGETIISRPRTGFLRFRKVDSVYLLYECKPPDWTVTAPHTEAQYLAEQDKIQKQQEQLQKQSNEQLQDKQLESQQQSKPVSEQSQQSLREPINTDSTALQQPPQTEAAHLAAEGELTPPKDTEQAKLQPQNQVESVSQEQTPSKPRERVEPRVRRKASPESSPGGFQLSRYKYWFTMAGLFIVGAILISVMYKFKK